MNKIWKVVVIILASVIGALGTIFLGIYLSGGFRENLTYPQDIFFVNVDTLDKRLNAPYYEYENFQLMISSETEKFNQDKVTLSFPTNQTNSTVRYLKAVQLNEVFAGDSVNFYYAYDNDGNILKFASCAQGQATHITNGIIIVPVRVTIDKVFDALVCLAPDNLNSEVEVLDDEIVTPLYNVGGYSQIIGRSDNLNISSISTYVYIDVPVEDFEIVGITGENISPNNVLGLNEYELNFVKNSEGGYFEASADSLFSVVLNLTPARSVYRFGRNGDVGGVAYKKIIFNINPDESFITFADEDGEEIDDKTIYAQQFVYNAGIKLKDLFGEDFNEEDYTVSIGNWSQYEDILNSVYINKGTIYVNIKNNEIKENFEIEIVANPIDDELETLTKIIYGYDRSLKYYDNNFNGISTKTTTLGAIFKSWNRDGDSQIHAGIFKNSILEDKALALSNNSISNLFELMKNQDYGISKTELFNISEIAIDGFDIDDRFKEEGNEIDFSINRSTKVFANNPDSVYSLGIEISSTSYAQSRIRNILLSIQFKIGDVWYDATQLNQISGQKINALFNFDAENLSVTTEDLKIDTEDPLYNFYFYRPQSSSNMSYWEIVATGVADNLEEYGITDVKLVVYYLHPETGLVLNDQDYGPYYVDSIINPAQETVLDWNHDDKLLTNEEIGHGNFNNRVLIDEDRILLNNIASIDFIASPNPTYKTIRYFIFHEYDGVNVLPNLDTIFNVTRYFGEINGISGSNIAIYEINSFENALIYSDLGDYLNLEINLTFAVVEDDIYGTPIVYNIDGQDTYSIVSLPLGELEILYAPIRIEKALKNITTDYDDSLAIAPYHINSEKYGVDYFLQGTKNNLTYRITVEDAELFEKLVLNGSIVLGSRYIDDAVACNDIYLYYEMGNYSYSVKLEDVLLTLIENKSVFESNGILRIIPNLDSTTYEITLSIKDINFNTNEDEKKVAIDLTYTINAENIPATYINPKIISTNNFYIYSGKILYISFGEDDESITNGFDGYIYVEKSVKDDDFYTSIYRFLKVNNSTVYTFEADEYTFVKSGIFKFLVGNDLYRVEVENDFTPIWYQPCNAPNIAPLTVNNNATFNKYLTFASGSYAFNKAGKYKIVVNDEQSTEYFVEVIKNKQGDLMPTWYLKDSPAPTTNATDIYEKTELINLYDAENYVNVSLEGFGINDLYLINTDNSSVAQIVPINDKYSLNFLQSGMATLLLNPDYQNSDFQSTTLTFVVFSNYNLTALFGNELGENDPADNPLTIYPQITNYSSLEYTLVGKSDITNINFRDLIKIFASVEDVSEEITDKFIFNVTYDNNTDLIYTVDNTQGKIEIIKDGNNQITGIGIRNNIGRNVTLVVSVISPELGAYFTFNIKIIPYNQIVGTIDSHTGAEKPANAEPDSVAVFAQADINVNDFQYQEYSNGYTSVTIPNLKYSLYSSLSEDPIFEVSINSTMTNVNLNNEFGETIAILTFNTSVLQKIIFLDVESLQKYIIKITWAGSTNVYDLNKTYIFYVLPNIQPDEESFKNNENIDENGKIHLNNQDNSIMNGDKITIKFDPLQQNIIVSFGKTGIEIKFNRIFSGLAFDTYLLKIGSEYYSGSEIKINISNIKKPSEQSIIISYNNISFEIVFYASPNITTSSEANTVIFDGEEYVALYATQDISNLRDWFLYNGEADINIQIRFGTLVTADIIKSLPKLNALNGTISVTEDSKDYFVTKNDYGLIESTIIVSYGSGANREFVAVKVLIFPIEWNYIEYSEVDENTDEVTYIFDGHYSETIESGENYQVSTSFISSKASVQTSFDNLVSNNKITFKLYLITGESETLCNNSSLDSVYLGIVNGKLTLVVQDLGKDRSYRLEFIFKTTVDEVTAEVTFSYYVDITHTQTIKINYPYGASGTEEDIETFINYQNIYHSQFNTNNTFVIDLNSSLNNFSGGKYVELYNDVELYNETTLIDQSTVVENYNKLIFEIYAVYDYRTSPRTQITTNLGNFITISNGVVTLINSTNNKVGYIIKISTPNGAENYYKIISEPNISAKVVTAEDGVDIYYNSSVFQEDIIRGTEISVNDIIIINGPTQNVSGYTISKSFDLSNLELGGTTYSTDIKFGLVDSNGNVLNNTNSMIFIALVGGNPFVVVKDSANDERGFLIVYTQKDGIIRRIEMFAESPYDLVYNGPTEEAPVYGDIVDIDISNYIKFFKNDSLVNKGLSYRLTFNDNNEYIDYSESGTGAIFSVKPLKTEKTFNIKIEVWEGFNPTEETICEKTIEFVVKPNITIKQNVTGSTKANKTSYNGINISSLFEQLGGEFDDYRYDVSISWDGSAEESITINGSNTGVGISDLLTEKISLKISAVATTRTAVITIVLYKGESLNTKEGDSFTSTYTLTIEPDTTITVTYPDYGTGITFNQEYIHWESFTGSLDIEEKVTVAKDEGVLGTPSPSVEYYSTDINKITINKTTGVITAISEVSADTEVTILIKVDGITRATYNIVITNENVFTAKFADNSIAKNEELPDSEINAGDNPFGLDFGSIIVNTKGFTFDKPFTILLTPTPKNAGISSVSPINVYGIGGSVMRAAELFVLKSAYVEEAPTGIEGFDILGREDDTDIATLSEEGVLTFKEEGTFALKVVISGVASYYYVVVNSSSEATYYTSTNKTLLTLNEIFGDSIGDSIDYDMYTYTTSFEPIYGEVIQGIELVQPSALLNYYYYGYQIPFEIAKNRFNFGAFNEEDETVIDSVAIKGFKFENVSFNVNDIKYETRIIKIYNELGTQVATYKYTIVYDYKFPEDSFDAVHKDEDGEITSDNGVDYGDNELDNYNSGDYLISKLIELDAGSNCHLIDDILVGKLGLTNFKGFNFDKITFKSTAGLINGLYISNPGYLHNISGIIGLSYIDTGRKLNDYLISPYGAQNDGDIVHLQLDFGNKTYILRIKIKPTISMISKSQTGELTTKFQSNEEGNFMNYALSNFVNISGILASNVVISVLDDSDAQFVDGSGNNRSIHFGTGSTSDDYGVKLYKTVLGGVRIRFMIADPYGYLATDENGTPVTFTLNYQNEGEISPEFIPVDSVQSIYEGDTFSIVYRYTSDGKTKYRVFNGTYWETETEDLNATNVIMLENIGDGSSIIENIGARLTVRLEELEGLLKENDLETNFLPNTRYASSTSITGNTLMLTLSYVNGPITETCRLNINIAINQRYKFRPKGNYNNFQELYLGNGRTYSLMDDLFEIFDLKENKKASNISLVDVTLGDQIEEDLSNYLTYNSENGNFGWQNNAGLNYSNKIANGGAQTLTFTFTLKNDDDDTDTIISRWNKYTINYNITPYYYQLDTTNVTTYLNYGVVVTGTGSSTNTILNNWGAGFEFKDYYGNLVPNEDNPDTLISPNASALITFSKISGTGTIDSSTGAITAMSAGGSVEVSIRSDGIQIGVIKVTMARYYGLEHSTTTPISLYNSSGSWVLPFDHPSGNGWGESVRAYIVGNGTTNPEFITGGLENNLFSYTILSGSGVIEYNSTLGCYVINNFGSEANINVIVKYMGREIGIISLNKANNVWSAYTYSTITYPIMIFDSNGGSYVNLKMQAAGTDVNAPDPAPTRTGYIFDGWYEDEALSQYSFNTMPSGITRLYAKWEIITYTITYELNGGTNNESNPETYTVEKPTITLQPATKDGYTFGGWYYYEWDDENEDGEVDEGELNEIAITQIPKGSTGDVKLYAKWISPSYWVRFNANDGSSPEETTSQEFDYGVSQPLAANTFTREGYTFAGWATTADGEVAYGDEESYTIGAGNVTLYAVWTPISYSITYNLNGGTNNESNPATYTIEETPITLLEPTKTGYTFGDWYYYEWDDENEDGEVDEGELNEIAITQIPAGSTGNKTFYAQWTANEYIVTFDPNGGSGTMSPQTFTYGIEGVLNPNTYTRTGYTFAGWATTADGEVAYGDEESYTIGAGNVTLYAKWTGESYTVTFDANGGTGTMDPQTFTYGVAQNLTANTFTRTGYTFKGWATTEGGSKEYDNGEEVTDIGEITLYAKWSPISYSITYNLNGGSATGNPVSSTYGEIFHVSNPTKEGYTFTGWILSGSNHNYETAYYIRIDLTDPDNPNLEYITSIETIIEPLKGKDYAALGDLSTTNNGSVTLTATWTPISYSITYELNGGANNEDNPNYYTIETETIILQAATKDGYTFAGWYYYEWDDENEDDEVDEGELNEIAITQIPKGSTGNINLYAKWTIITYNIFYELYDGTNGDNPSTYTIETETITLQAATKDGYTFAGWYYYEWDDENEDDEVDEGELNEIAITQIPKGSTEDVTLYAKWTIITYNIFYELYGGTNGDNPSTYTIETGTITLQEATKDGYTFGGWYTNSIFSGDVITEIPLEGLGNINLYAKWIED